VTTTVQNVSIKVQWVAPTNNFKVISEYAIYIKENVLGTYSEDKTLCDGSHSLTFSNLYCSIPMTALRASGYGYAQGEVPQFKIKAYNERGWSLISDENTLGAAIETEPIQMG
jgi:hypothetical protein